MTSKPDNQYRIAMLIATVMGAMGMVALLGITLATLRAVKLDPTVVNVLSGVVGGAMTGLPSLLARLHADNAPAGTPADPLNTINANAPTDPIPVQDVGDKPPAANAG